MIGLNRDITGEKIAEEQLLLHNQHLREQANLLEMAHDAILVRDMSDVITFWNHGAVLTYGFTKEEAIGQSPHSLLQTQFPISLAQINQKLIEQEKWEGELIHKRQDGGKVIVESRMALLRDEHGQPKSIMEINRDVTQRRQAEEALQEAHNKLESRIQRRTEALRQSEERARATFEQAAVGMALVGLDGSWLDVNSKLCQIVGYSREELSVLTFQDITHPDDLNTDLANVGQVLVGKIETYSMEKRYIRKDASIVWINLTVSLARDLHGAPQYFISVVEDISTRKMAQEALKDSEAKYRFLADSMAQIVFTAAPGGANDYFNQRWFDYTGMTLEESLGYGSQLVMHPDDLQPCVDLWIIALATGTSYEVECRLRRASDGVYRWHLVRSIPRKNEAGEILQWVGTSTDIEDFKQGQAALLHINDELEAIVKERTTELICANAELAQFNAQLREQQAELEIANARLDIIAKTDGLTGLKNHRAFQEILITEYDRATRYGTPLSLLLLDIDHFKMFNDQFGHPAGDHVLKQAATILEAVSRSSDCVARYGGEEFVVILPGTDAQGAMECGERIRTAIAAHRWKLRTITISIGATTLRPEIENSATLVTEADQALYQSKAAGRNRTTHFRIEEIGTH